MSTNVWAVLRDRESGSIVSGLDNDTSLLFHRLATPRTVGDAMAKVGVQVRSSIAARLVCDGILQIGRGDGSFVHGIRANREVFDREAAPSEHSASRLDRLSRLALGYAARLPPPISSLDLARRLYAFHSDPRTTRWETLLSGAGAVLRWLGIRPRSPLGREIHRHYLADADISDSSSWLSWYRKGADSDADLRHKIYVSPALPRVPEALARVIGVCCALGVPAFKVGANLQNLVRPDRIVVYFDNEDARWRVAEELRLALRGIEAHGVPFTARIDEAGLLGWAVDPAPDLTLRPAEQPWSWRTAVCSRLAATIAGARELAPSEDVVEFALARLRLDGIESDGWRQVESC